VHGANRKRVRLSFDGEGIKNLFVSYWKDDDFLEQSVINYREK